MQTQRQDHMETTLLKMEKSPSELQVQGLVTKAREKGNKMRLQQRALDNL